MWRGLVIIGVGNAYRGDDAVGLEVARQLQQTCVQWSDVRVLTQHGEGTQVMQAWQGADTVVLVDAVQSGAAPGTVHRLDAIAQPLPPSFLRCSTHAFGVAESIELARALGQLPPRVLVFGIEGKTFAPGVGLSAEVAQAVPEVVRCIRQELS
jgi:hydrogenase maturation protease